MAIDRSAEAQTLVFDARNRAATARSDLEFAREEYRTALDADAPSAALERRYRAAQRELRAAQTSLASAESAAAATEPAATEAQRRAGERMDDRLELQELVTFLLRFALVLAALAVGYLAQASLRSRGSRYLPIAGAILVFATIMAFALAGDYATDYFNPIDAGVLILAIVGVLATLVAFWALQRYLARRLPYRRVRKGECPFCAYPVRGNERCEGCGRGVIGACMTCEQPRRVGTVFCGSCGAA